MKNTNVFPFAFLAIMLVVSCSHSNSSSEVQQKSTIRQRIESTRTVRDATAEARPALTRDLVFMADFENGASAFLGDGTLLLLDTRSGHFRNGKKGRGYYFEKPQQNQLPPEIADVETDISAFVMENGAVCNLVSADTRFGQKALSISMPDSNALVQTKPFLVSWKHKSWHEKEWRLLASCYVRGPTGSQVTVSVSFLPAEMEEQKKDDPPRIEDTSEPQTVELTGDWQRIACLASGDTRLRKREAIFTFSTPDKITELLADGFQWEQARHYPHNNLMPTTWVAGGVNSDSTTLQPGEPLNEQFPRETGTISLWITTPLESNLPQPGNSIWFGYGSGWNPGWRASAGTCEIPGAKLRYMREYQTAVKENEWCHFAMTWNATNLTAYLNGEQVGSTLREPLEKPLSFETSKFILGGNFVSAQAANAVLDDFTLFRRALSSQEIATLATAPDLRVPLSTVNLSQAERCLYYRDEDDSVWRTTVCSTAATNCVFTFDWAIGDLITDSRKIEVPPGLSSVDFRFSPSSLACGDYEVRLGVAGAGAFISSEITIRSALRRDHFLLSSWGGGGETAEWRAFCTKLGLNAIDTYGVNYEQLGREGFLYNWHYNFGNSIASEANLAEARRLTERESDKRKPYPNWRSTLLNSEVSSGALPPDEERAAWFDNWAAEKLGFAIPTNGWRLGRAHNPTSARFTGADPEPQENGVYRSCRGVDFMKWWYNYGSGWWRLNAEAAKVITARRPDVICWHDPLTHAGQVADLGGASTWSYSYNIENFISRFEDSFNNIRGTGKEFYATFGSYYYPGNKNTSGVIIPDGSTNTLVLTSDELKQRVWLATTQVPSDGLTYYSYNVLYDGLKRQNGKYAEPGTDDRLAAVLKNEILPVGTLLKHLPNAPRTVALLFPRSTLWLCADEGKFGWGTSHYPSAWKKWVGELGIPYDILDDREITPERLQEYKVILFPMAQFVVENVYNSVMAAAEAGVHVVVDSYCGQQYPGMKKLNQEYYYKMPRKADYADMEAETRAWLAEVRERLVPQFEFHVEGHEGSVFYNVREADGAQYMSIVNNHRREGTYSQWTTNTFKPYGAEQSATISMRLAEGAAVYDLLEGKRLKLINDGGVWKGDMQLEPHGGHLLCVYKAPVDRIVLVGGTEYVTGKPGLINLAVQTKTRQNLPGRQLLHVEIHDPSGAIHDESGLYRTENGVAIIPFRPAINEKPGTWRISVREQASGVSLSSRLKVTSGT